MDHEKMRRQVHQGIDRLCAPLSSDPYRVQHVLNAAKTEGGSTVVRKLPRFAVVLMIVLALSLSTAIAAGVITWQRNLENMLHVTEETKEYYQWTELFDSPGISVTQGDVTITLEESIVDSNAAYFAFRIAGYQPPKGSYPTFASTAYAMGDDTASLYAFFDFFGRQEGSDPDSYSIVPQTDENGDLVFRISMFTDADSMIGQTMKITLTDLGAYTNQGESFDVHALGTWSFEWALKGVEHYWDMSGLNLDIGGSGTRITHVHLSPIHVQMTMDVELTLAEFEKLGNGNSRLPSLYGIKMKDGRLYEHITEASTSGYTSPDPDSHEYRFLFMLNRIIEPAQVDCFLFSCPGANGESDIVEVPFNKLYSGSPV